MNEVIKPYSCYVLIVCRLPSSLSDPLPVVIATGDQQLIISPSTWFSNDVLVSGRCDVVITLMA